MATLPNKRALVDFYSNPISTTAPKTESLLSLRNRNFCHCLRHCLVTDRSVSPIYPSFYNVRVHAHTSYPHIERRLFTASGENVNPVFPTHQCRLHRYLATLVFSARAVNHYSVAALFFGVSPPSPRFPPLLPASATYGYRDASRRNYTKRPTRDDAAPLSNVK